jgi:hypothetical protein
MRQYSASDRLAKVLSVRSGMTGRVDKYVPPGTLQPWLENRWGQDGYGVLVSASVPVTARKVVSRSRLVSPV